MMITPKQAEPQWCYVQQTPKLLRRRILKTRQEHAAHLMHPSTGLACAMLQDPTQMLRRPAPICVCTRFMQCTITDETPYVQTVCPVSLQALPLATCQAGWKHTSANLPHATCHASFVRPQGTLNCPAALHQLLCVAWQIAANVILNSHMIMSIKRFCAPGPAWRPCRAAPSAGSSCPA